MCHCFATFAIVIVIQCVTVLPPCHLFLRHHPATALPPPLCNLQLSCHCSPQPQHICTLHICTLQCREEQVFLFFFPPGIKSLHLKPAVQRSTLSKLKTAIIHDYLKESESHRMFRKCTKLARYDVVLAASLCEGGPSGPWVV